MSDSILMLALGSAASLMLNVVVVLLVLATGESFLAREGSGVAGGLAVLGLLLMALAMVLLPYRYEVVPTARDGQTTAKRAHKIAVVSYPVDDGIGVSRRASRIRWAVPHGAFVVGSAVGLGSVSVLGAWGVVVASCLGIAAWTAVYASALLDGQRRGWHDKAAGTIVVSADAAPDERRSCPSAADGTRRTPGVKAEQPAQSWGLVSDYYTPPGEPRPPQDSEE